VRVEGKEEAELARLFRAALAGDEKAYGDFLSRASATVRAFARRRVGQSGIDPEDVVQETLLALHLKRHTWRTDAAVTPWLYAIARFKLIDAFRRSGRHPTIDVDLVAETVAAPEPEPGASARDVERALASLAPGQRAVVSSISVDGNSIGETAQKLGMNETAVRVALHRGLAAISKRFGQT
jgi:RNA polymerase sigma-70 factor, ECF subfamily